MVSYDLKTNLTDYVKQFYEPADRQMEGWPTLVNCLKCAENDKHNRGSTIAEEHMLQHYLKYHQNVYTSEGLE